MKKALGITLLFILLSIGFVFADTNGVWHRAEDVRPGTFGDDEGGGNYSFPNKLGIGTTSPRSSFEVAGGLRAKKGDSINQDISNVGYAFENDGDTGMFAVGGTATLGSDLIFKINDDERLRILDSSGNVGIGTTSPSEKLDVNGNLKVRGSSLYIGNDAELRDAGTNYLYTPDRFDSGSQIRAPIFYDRDNTGYYADPASTSKFNSIHANIIYDKGNPAYYANLASTSKFNSIQANIFYDKGNTGYYANPAGTSNFNRVIVNHYPSYSKDVATKEYVDENMGNSPLVFDVYHPDTSTWVCVQKDLQDYCGDWDGCTIKILMQHETHGGDQVKVIEETIYMEQGSMSNNNGAGKYGWTRQQGGGDHSWITGTSGTYSMFRPWDWVWMKNYKHSYCGGNNVAFSDPYKFSFMSHPNVRSKFIVYD